MNSGTHRRVVSRGARPGLRLWLTVVKGAALGSLLAVLVVGGLRTAASGGTWTAAVDDAYQRVVDRAVTDHRCSYRGFDEDSHAPSALIRTARGDVRLVSFEKGWDVYTGGRPGDLIAVCLDDREPATDRATGEVRRVTS